MKEYQKINTIFKRDERGKIIEGEYTTPAFEYLQNNIWQFTEKVDGTNIRIGWDGQTRTIGGRTNNANIPAFLFQRLIELFPEDKLSKVFPKNEEPLSLVLYGEGYGAKIQKVGGNYKADGTDFVLFDVMIGDWLLQRVDVEDIAAKLDIKVVPVIGTGTLQTMISIVRNGLESTWGSFAAEGIVARPAVELCDRSGDRIICKLKSRDFR